MDEDEGSLALRVWLAAWRTLVQLFYVIVVLLVFANLHSSLAALITALIGTLYCTLRAGILGNALYAQAAVHAFAVDIERIKCAVDSDHVSDLLLNPAAAARRMAKARVPIYFEQGGLAVISIVCLWQIFAAIGRGDL